MEKVIRLSEATDCSLVGGKAVGLARLIQAGLRVKCGVVIPTMVIDGIVAAGAVSDVLLDVVTAFFGQTFNVAVRSSAVEEDGGINSWAGQFVTILNVASRDALRDAILHCVAAKSALAPRAYGNSVAGASGKLAIVIQSMVDAAVSGVMFTVNPLRPDSPEVVVEAVDGLAEEMVSGRREPRRLFIDSETLAVIRDEGDKVVCLSAAQLKELVTTGLSITRDLHLQDIEWAIERDSGLLYLVQARSVTAVASSNDGLHKRIICATQSECSEELERLRGLGLEADHDVFSDQNIAELITPHPHRLALSMFTACFAHGNGAIRCGRNDMGYAIGEELQTGFFTLVGGQPRCSIVHDALTYRIRGVSLPEYAKFVACYLERIDGDATLANYPEVVLYNQQPTEQFLSEMFGGQRGKEIHELYRVFFARIRELENTYSISCRREWLPAWDRRIAGLVRLNSTASSAAKLAVMRLAVNALRREACVYFVKVARLGFFAYARLRQTLLAISDNPEHDLHALTAGIDPADSPSLRLGGALADYSAGRRSLDSLVAEFGHLGPNELEIGVPRYREDPDVFRSLAQNASADISTVVADNRRESEETAARLERQMLNAETLAEFQATVRAARTYLALRETVKHAFLRGYDVVRTQLLGLAAELKINADLPFHLTLEELCLFETDAERAIELAVNHAKEFAACLTVAVPAVIDSRRLEVIGVLPEASAGSLRGIGVSNSIVEGVALVLERFPSATEMPLITGQTVLVTVTTDPAWTPVLTRLAPTGGLVTEVGGLLAHGAIIARELGIAAVLNIPQATKQLHTGMRVRVNGPLGSVEILS